MLQKEILRVLKGNVNIKDMDILFQKNKTITQANDRHLTKYNNSGQ